MRLGSSSRDGDGADLRGDDRESALAPVRAGPMLAENSFDSVGHLLESFSEACADGFTLAGDLARGRRQRAAFCQIIPMAG